MKKALYSIVGIFLFSTVLATNQKEVSSTIKEVTVYQAGAQIMREANVKIDRGVSELHFKGLPEGIINKSIQVSAEQSITIVSVVHSIDYLNKQKSTEEIIALEKRREILRDSISIQRNIQKVLQQEKEMILSNRTIGGENGVMAADLEKMASFFRNRLTEIEGRNYSITLKIRTLQKEMISVSQQLMELNAQIDKPTSLVKVKVSSYAAISSKFELRYFIADAGWQALYDIRIEDVNSSLGLFYKAQVNQNTGEDWKDVLLTLSTGNPSISNYKPELSPYLLTFNNYYAQHSTTPTPSPYSGTVSGRVIDADENLPLPGASVMVKGTNIGVATDIDGNYSIKLPSPNSTLVFSFIGMKSQEHPGNTSVRNVRMESDNVALDEVIVTGYGVAGSTPGMRIRGMSSYTPEKKVNIPMSIEKSQVATEFKIELPYSIPSDNQVYDVSILEYRVPAEYKYASVPKLSTDAYLMASIPNWQVYELLNGDVNLFFKGIYQGKTYFDLSTIEDTLTVSVGRDRDIQIKRESMKEFARSSLIGSSRREQRIWEISVKNNKSLAVAIDIEDQIPVSKLSDIKIEQIETLGATVDEATGKVKWSLNIQPGESRKLTLKYTVKYPKDRKLLVE
ncbi:MAG: mucoidy inhibitor MuiA family protein [Bacteroidales bacterium]|jgi:hypothetical protein|nr:mucoidy inhibitor MuiA family protein [Bacteroidales bacterium]MDD4384057.1 mucoidy inhibitor MuiA family protein [Bacteroidales bacterium]MDY0197850.1 mucoidy inhibitor MuiA family protein [Tenuifilaceae bacterium]